jgi:hypothetical protein
MKPEEKELLALQKEIEDALEEDAYIHRKVKGLKDDTLTVRIPKRKVKEKNPSISKKKKAPVKKKRRPNQTEDLMEMEIETPTVSAAVEEIPKTKKKPKKKMDVDSRPKKKITKPAHPKTPKKKPTSEQVLVEPDVDPWNDLEVPWKGLSYPESAERFTNDYKAIENLSLEDRMKRYIELVVLGKGGKNYKARAKDRAVVDFFNLERANVGMMMGDYADKKGGEMLAMCDYVSTLGTKILEFEKEKNGAQAQCYFRKDKLKKTDAWVCTITMEVVDETTKQTRTTKSKKYIHQNLVPILESVVFIVGFDGSVAGAIEDFVADLDPGTSLKEKVRLVSESDISNELLNGLKYSIGTIAEACEWIEGFIDDCWKNV